MRTISVVSFYQNASSFETSAEISVASGSEQRGIDLSLQPGFFVSGVVRAPAGVTVADVVVAAYNLNGTRRGFQKVSPTGSYTLVLPSGTFKIGAYDERLILATEFHADAASFQKASTVEIDGNRSIDFTLEIGGRLSGTVLRQTDDSPLEDALVYAVDSAGDVVATSTTGLDGRFSMVVLPGDYRVIAADPSGDLESRYLGGVPDFGSASSVSVLAGQNISELDISLPPATDESMVTLFIPVVAHATGGNGTFFRSDVWIQNPHVTPLDVALTLRPPPSSGKGAVTRTVTVPARAQRVLRDLVSELFETEGGAALELEAADRFAATSRTYNDPGDPRIGTSGLSLPAAPLSSSLARAVIVGLSNTDEYRSNVGVYNVSNQPIDVVYELYDGSGELLASSTRRFEPKEWYQANTIFAELGQSEVDSASAFVTLRSEQGSFFSYGSVVDSVSGDATLILPTAIPPIEED